MIYAFANVHIAHRARDCFAIVICTRIDWMRKLIGIKSGRRHGCGRNAQLQWIAAVCNITRMLHKLCMSIFTRARSLFSGRYRRRLRLQLPAKREMSKLMQKMNAFDYNCNVTWLSVFVKNVFHFPLRRRKSISLHEYATHCERSISF